MRLPHQLKLVRNDKNGILQDSGIAKKEFFSKNYEQKTENYSTNSYADP